MSSRRIGNYQVTDYIGSGGFGTVFKAEDASNPGRTVALKELHKRHTRNAVIKQRFFQEAVAMARLDHPNLPRLFTFGEDGGSYYLVMELLSGNLLSDELQENGALPASSATAIMSQVLEALSYAHRNGIIHRDLKPDNIMLLEGGSLCVKVLDFGIARMVGGENLTLAGEGFGTPAYMSPERISGGTSDDPRIDIYSAGIILFEMLTGRAPFDSSASDPVIYWSEMRKHHEDDPLPPLAPLGIPAALERIVRRATAKSIEDRYASADEMLAEIKSVSTGDIAGGEAPAETAATKLFLTTVPASAEVYVDDVLHGTSDAIRGKILINGLTPGLHSVRVTKTGYSEYRINVVLEEGRQTDLQVALPARATVAMPPADHTAAGGFETIRLEGNELKTALFVVESLPAGATVLIGSNVVAQAGEDGRATIRLTPGEHQIEVKAPSGYITRKMVTVTTQDTGLLKTVAFPIEQPATLQQAVPAASEPLPSGQTGRLIKGKRMAAAATVVLLLALAAAAYFVLRSPARGNAQSESATNQTSQQSSVVQPGTPDATSTKPNSFEAQAQADQKKVAEDQKKVQTEQEQANAEKQAAEKEAANPEPPPPATNPPTTNPPTTNPPTTNPPVVQETPSQVESQQPAACIGVIVTDGDGSPLRNFGVVIVEQPDTADARDFRGRTNHRGVCAQCGLTAGRRVRVVVMGLRGIVRATRELMLRPGKNVVEVRIEGIAEPDPDRKFPGGRKRPRQLRRP